MIGRLEVVSIFRNCKENRKIARRRNRNHRHLYHILSRPVYHGPEENRKRTTEEVHP